MELDIYSMCYNVYILNTEENIILMLRSNEATVLVRA